MIKCIDSVMKQLLVNKEDINETNTLTLQHLSQY